MPMLSIRLTVTMSPWRLTFDRAAAQRAQRPFGASARLEGLDAFSANQVDIGSLDQLVRPDAKPTHEFVRFAHTFL